MVKAPGFQCRWHGFIPGQGTKIPHAVQPKKPRNLALIDSCNSLGSLKSFLWHVPQLPGTRVLCFHILSFLRLYHWRWLGSLMAARWQVFFPSWVPSGLSSSPPQWLQLVMTVTCFLCWCGRNYSISQPLCLHPLSSGTLRFHFHSSLNIF